MCVFQVLWLYILAKEKKKGQVWRKKGWSRAWIHKLQGAKTALKRYFLKTQVAESPHTVTALLLQTSHKQNFVTWWAWDFCGEVNFHRRHCMGWSHPPFLARPSAPNPVHTGPAVEWSQLKHLSSPGTSGNSATGSASKKQVCNKRCFQCLKTKHSFYRWNFSQHCYKQSEALRKTVPDQLWWLIREVIILVKFSQYKKWGEKKRWNRKDLILSRTPVLSGFRWQKLNGDRNRDCSLTTQIQSIYANGLGPCMLFQFTG